MPSLAAATQTKNMACGIACFLMVSSVSVAVQQQSPDSVSFDVASVKPSPKGTLGGGFSASATRFSAENITLSGLIEYAYEVKAFQVVDAPSWATEERFDVDGTVAATTKITPGLFRLMMRRLLEQRFALRTHREMRKVPILALVLAAPDRALGPALKRVSPECRNNGVTLTCYRRNNLGDIEAVGYDWRQINLAADLMRFGASNGMVIIDHTGLEGRFDLRLQWTPTPEFISPVEIQSANPSVIGVSLGAALKEQLGLTLRREEDTLEFLVVDKVARPSPN